MDITYVDFLQFQRYLIAQAELEETFIYIIHKHIDFSIDFSYRLKTSYRLDLRSYGHWFEKSKSANRNLAPSQKNHLLSLFTEKPFSATFRICLLINVQDCSKQGETYICNHLPNQNVFFSSDLTKCSQLVEKVRIFRNIFMKLMDVGSPLSIFCQYIMYTTG